MPTLFSAPEAPIDAPSAGVEVPTAFRRAFQPSLADRASSVLRVARQSVRAWLDRQNDRIWHPIRTDRLAELERQKTYIEYFGVTSQAFNNPAARRCSDW